MKFLIDMPLSPGLATWLRRQGHDAAHAADLGLALEPDAAILERARNEGRVVITADLDYARLLALAEAQEPGLVLFRGGEYGEQECVDRLEQVFRKVAEGEIEHSIVVIERQRIRRRWLPLEPHQ